MPTTRRTQPQGFTLIELLMVILIIGVLAGLLLVAVRAAMRAAQKGADLNDITQMAIQLETYKNDRGAYPPTFGAPLDLTAIVLRQQAIVRHVAKAFPRYIPSPPLGTVPNGHHRPYYGLREDILRATKYLDPARFPNGSANPDSELGIRGLDINDLDAAESLVFWLGGFSDPTSETKLLGFRSDPASPFDYIFTPPPADPMQTPLEDRTQYLKNRAQPLYPFDPKRLVDRDGDGWLEYVQQGTAPADMPPFVYFDNTAYNFGIAYPPLESGDFIDKVVVWGHCVPYAHVDTLKSSLDPTDMDDLISKIQWMESKKFQLIAPGRDGSYGRQIVNLTPLTVPGEIRFWPDCVRGPARDILPDTEMDNLTNFSTGFLGDDRP